MNFPKLYKRTSTGKIQEWEISTEKNKVIVIQGQVDGKKQRYEETISKGKNIGRANETTPAQQAIAESQSKWDKKHKKDYHLTVEACNKKVKIANVGGYLPMLAQDFHKHAERHLKYPCYVQPKLDGLRCTATKKDGAVKLWFRSGKEIITMGHIATELKDVMTEGDIFDGELYVHGQDFNKFTGAIRANKNLNPEITKSINYVIYDYPRIGELKEDAPYIARYDNKRFFGFKKEHVRCLGTHVVYSFEEAMELYKQFIEYGYEGMMFRNLNMPYEQKRSYNLLKYKEFVEDEFVIIGAEEGKGKLAGHVGSFICKIEVNRILQDIGGKSFKFRGKVLKIGGKSFKFGNKDGYVKAKMKGETKYLKHLFENPKEYLGKPLTIQYQNLSTDGVPRFPVGKSIRFDK